MPNIIEQQDLLKGLPDNRLAMMMQSPTGDIPPFLVAAEAQRRQAIRQQFAGGPQESVVDTLTKQLAGAVPQNIQSGPQQPPQMPPPMMPPQMAGVAALQQQMPQQAPQQAMRDGGMVRRYDVGGSVQSSFYNPQPGASAAEQMAQTYMFLNPGMTYEEALQRAGVGQPLARPTVGELAAAQAGKGGVTGVGNYSVLRRPSEAPTVDSYVEEAATGSETSPQKMPIPSTASMGMSFTPSVPTANPTAPRDPEAAKGGTSPQNKKMTLDEYKRQLEGIYGVNAEDSEYIRGKLEELYGDETSNWEKSQKWFAAAQAAMEPGQNNWQAAVNALSAFGGGMADERASERENQQALAEALLRYEMADMQERRKGEQAIAAGALEYQLAEQKDQEAREAAAYDRKLKAQEFYAGGADKTIDAINQSLKSTVMEKQAYIKTLPEDPMTGQPKVDPNDPVIRNYDLQIKSYREMIDAALGQRASALAGYGELTGTDPSVMVYQPGRLTTYGK